MMRSMVRSMMRPVVGPSATIMAARSSASVWTHGAARWPTRRVLSMAALVLWIMRQRAISRMPLRLFALCFWRTIFIIGGRLTAGLSPRTPRPEPWSMRSMIRPGPWTAVRAPSAPGGRVTGTKGESTGYLGASLGMINALARGRSPAPARVEGLDEVPKYHGIGVVIVVVVVAIAYVGSHASGTSWGFTTVVC